MVGLPSLDILKRCVDVTLGTLFSRGLGSAGLMFGLDYLRGFFLSKQVYYSVNLAFHQSRGQGFVIRL